MAEIEPQTKCIANPCEGCPVAKYIAAREGINPGYLDDMLESALMFYDLNGGVLPEARNSLEGQITRERGGGLITDDEREIIDAVVAAIQLGPNPVERILDYK